MRSTLRAGKLECAAALLALAAVPARAQSAREAAAYWSTVFTTTGAATPVVEQPMLGDLTNVWGLQAFYTHLDFGDYGNLAPFGTLRADAFGGALYASALSGRLGLAVNGAYIAPNCPAGVSCQGNVMAGGSVLLRLARASVGSSGYGAADPGGRVTLSLRAAGGWAAPGADRYASATFGVPIAMSAPEGRYRVVGFASPGVAWGSLKALAIFNTENLAVGVPFNESGAAGMLSGGFGFIPEGRGIGVHVGFQKIFVNRAGAQYGVAMTWNGA